MLKATIYVDTPYLGNEIFNKNNTILNRDNCLESYRLLKEKLRVLGVDLSTQDLNSISESQFVIYSDVPLTLPLNHCPEKSILLLFESEIIKPVNWENRTQRLFNYILTWNDDLIDNLKFFKFNFPQNLTKRTKTNCFQDKKFCTLIAANKSSKHKNELYSERINAIKWFEKNHPQQLDLYGFGWDKGIHPEPTPFYRRLYRKFPRFQPNAFYPIQTYKGSVQDKIAVMAQYKYSICYENAKNITGYITEKIFDSFIAGTIPVYLGPPNKDIYIPQNCYIDKLQFKNYASLYRHLCTLTEKEYNEYRKNIDIFLSSTKIQCFSNDFFVDQICRIVAKFL